MSGREVVVRPLYIVHERFRGAGVEIPVEAFEPVGGEIRVLPLPITVPGGAGGVVSLGEEMDCVGGSHTRGSFSRLLYLSLYRRYWTRSLTVGKRSSWVWGRNKAAV